MKTRNILISICTLTISFLFVTIGISNAENNLESPLTKEYMIKLSEGEQDLPSLEWVKETEKIYQQTQGGKPAVPTNEWIKLTENQYNQDMERVRQQINDAGIETDGTRATANVYTGTTYTFNQADCGNKGKSTYCDQYEDSGNFRCGWGTNSCGYADALSEFDTTFHYHSATTWAWVGKQIQVHGTDDARIYYDGDYAWYVMGGCSYPTWASTTLKIIVYNVTDSQEVASKTIAYNSNFAPLPNYGSDDFNDYIDCQLLDGKTYALKMEVTEYVSGGSEAMGDMCSGLSPAAGGDGVDYNYIQVTWR